MTTDVASFASSEFTMRYKQPYTTEGLNKKFAGIQPRGIYRGYRLGVDAGSGDRTVEIVASTSYTDHLAVYETATGFSLTLRKTGGNFLVALTAYASQTVYITIWASYAVGATTAAFIRVYTEAEFLAAGEKDELVVLGKVDVPSAGNPVTSAMLSEKGRDMAWQNRTTEDIGWPQLYRNPHFAWGEAAATHEYSAAYWRIISDAPTTNPISVDTTDPYKGANHILMDYGAGSASWSVAQVLNIPVEEGQRIRVRLYKKSVQAATAGTAQFQPGYKNGTGSGLVGTAVAVDISSVDSAYVAAEAVIEVPSGSGITTLTSLGFSVTSATFGSAGDAIRVGEFQLWLEQSDVEDDEPARAWKGDDIRSALGLFEVLDDFADLASTPTLRPGGVPGTTAVRVERQDQKDDASTTPTPLSLPGQILELGKNLLNSGAQVRTPRIVMPVDSSVGDAYTLLYETEDDGAIVGGQRIYLSSATSPGMVFVTNCYWNGTVWTQEDATKASYKLTQGPGGLLHQSQASGVGPWADSAWGFMDQMNLNNDYSDFSGAAVRVGQSRLSTSADFRQARMRCERGDPAIEAYARILLWEMPPTGALLGTTVRIYRGFNGYADEGLLIATNCYWDGTNWNVDYAPIGKASVMFFGTDGWSLWQKSASVGTPWNDAAWDHVDLWGVGANPLTTLDDRHFAIENTTQNGSNPLYYTPAYNHLYAKNIVKAWGNLKMAGGGSFSNVEGFNIATPTFPGGGVISVQFASALFDGNYAVVLGDNGGQYLTANGWPTALGKTGAGFTLRYITAGSPSGGVGSMDTSGYEVDFVVLGRQDT
jgi:hypothetical protein